ncbi:MAG TPA: ribosome silencing factor [Paracoccaceae bacterium]|nr:ribosome silencing factor [Paracoccaceae bacterium]
MIIYFCPAPGLCGVYVQEDIVLSERSDAAQAATIAATGANGAVVDDDASSKLLALVLKSLEDDKAEEIVTIPLKGKSEMADNMVVATGRSSRQVSAIAEKLVDRIKHEMGIFARMEGKETGDWVLIDAGDVVVHVFRPEVREFYQLEKMWLPAGEAKKA